MRKTLQSIGMLLVAILGVLAIQPASANAVPTQRADFRVMVDQTGKVTVIERSGQVHQASGTEGSRLLSGWLGTCYPELYSNRGGGWCDGNGPDARYNGFVNCGNETFERTGPQKWAGDRTKSFAYCPSGVYSNYGGVDGYYV